FVEKYLGREESRILNSKSLAIDFGTESVFWNSHILEFNNVVSRAMKDRPEYAKLIENVWQNFVAYLGASNYGEFSVDTYVNELYLVSVAKLVCANILSGRPIISDDNEIKAILDGRFFQQKNIQNLVDYDYFGWINKFYVDDLVETAKLIQQVLIHYDFKTIPRVDLFGELLAQLSCKEHRLLLGQDFTPSWIAQDMVQAVLGRLHEEPKVLDMCCGSGVFLIETIKAVRAKYDIDITNYTADKDEMVFSCVMGFDIDPLAIMLAKVNWILSMRDLFCAHAGMIVIPIYHADSLFVDTPITHKMPNTDQDRYVLHFEGNKIELPSFMIKPEHRSTYDAFMAKCYSAAMARAEQSPSELSESELDSINTAIDMDSLDKKTDEDRKLQRISSYGLILALENLQRNGKNGIWYFVLNNNYKPGLVRNQFNCIVSNPPWLAMSKLADNPYKDNLTVKTNDYAIKPPGSAHLHMELATIFMLGAIDKYLKEDGQWMFVMPGSLLSGYNHEPLRDEMYRKAYSPVEARVDTIWELPTDAFKNKAIVLGGTKSNKKNPDAIEGRLYVYKNKYDECEYKYKKQGKRSCWTNKDDESIVDSINDHVIKVNQGADVFPRTVLFHAYTQMANGNWSIKPIEKTSEWYYLISESKKDICNSLTADGFSNEFMYDCFISKHLSPFFVAKPAKVLMPGYKDRGEWKAIDASKLATMNAATKYVFDEIRDKTEIGLDKLFNDKIDIYNKLRNQKFSLGKWMVLSNAGGGNPCAAYINLNEFERERLVIDQTLYWYIADSEEEAIYITGLVNSISMGKAIEDFQPEGAFGKRHIHTLPFKIMPKYDDTNDAHRKLVDVTKEVIEEWNSICDSDDIISKTLNPNSGNLPSRRKKQQAALRKALSYVEYERSCAEILGMEFDNAWLTGR
ncbi:N-6 DNA methylase, partial [Pseudobutyrivibrio sp.]